MTDDQLHNLFTYHPPFGTQQKRYESIRAQALNFAVLINELCPESREKSLAITAIQQACQWANASIAINEVEPAPLLTVEDEAKAEASGLFLNVNLNTLQRAEQAFEHQTRGIRGAEEYEKALSHLGLPLDKMRGVSYSLRCGKSCTALREWLPATAAAVPPAAKAEESQP